MKSNFIMVLTLGVFASLPIPAQHGHATPLEVVAKVHKAAALLADQDLRGLEVIRDSSSEFSWKDSYVFVVDCQADRVLANPAFPQRQGGDIKQHTDYQGRPYGRELCHTAQLPGGGWVEYQWPRPGSGQPARKVSFVLSVPGKPYQVGAGIYDDNISLKELQQIAQEWR